MQISTSRDSFYMRKGAAVTEAIIVIPVLMTLLYGVFYVWRLSIVTSAAQTAVRSEIMLHSLAVNADDTLNQEHWDYGKVGFSRDSDFYCNTLQVFPGVPAEAMTIRSRAYTMNESLYNVYDAMRTLLTDAAYLEVSVELPPQPFVHDRLDRPVYTATGICEVNPWKLNEKQFFGALTPWIEEMRSHEHAVDIQDEPTVIRNGSVSPLEGLPAK